MKALRVIGALVMGTAMPVVASVVSDPDDEVALTAFHTRVASYAALHVALELRVPPREVTGDATAIARARDALAALIVAERPNARAGDIFSPDVAAVFRRRMSAALGGDAWRLLSELNAEHPQAALVRPQVYQRFPTGICSYQFPATLLAILPPLPPPLEYRLAYTYLLLWDEHADLIVDVLPDAITPTLAARHARSQNSMDVNR